MRRGWLFVLILTGLAALARVGPAAAAVDHPASIEADAAKAEQAVAHHGGEAGPFDGPAILDLAIWTVVVFLALLAVLGKFAWKPMLAGLQQREENIRAALAEAQAAREEAQAIRADLQRQLAAANEQVRQILEEGRRAAQQLREAEMAKTMAEIQAERERLHREIEMQTNQAIQRIWSQAADLATLVASKALGGAITENGHRQLIERALADIRASGGGANGHA
jgi:F-type H+-transporting ATPase subunit b